MVFGGVSFGEELVLECVEDVGVVLLLLLLPRWQLRGVEPTARMDIWGQIYNHINRTNTIITAGCFEHDNMFTISEE